MTTLVRRPINDFMTLRSAMDRLIEDSFVPNMSRMGVMPVDIRADDDGYTIEAELPGFTADQININVLENTVTIKATREAATERTEASYLHLERHFGAIERSFSLPTTLDAAGAAANLDNGVLTLRVPKAEAAKPKSISIKSIVNN